MVHASRDIIITFHARGYFDNFLKFHHWMQFSKCAGLRVTDISLESANDVIFCHAKAENIFKMAPLFSNQTLDIKNCVIEIELYNSK